MIDIEDYKRKKKKALVTLVIFSVFFVGILLYMGGNGGSVIVCIPLIMIWTNFSVKYETLSMKIEILEELQKEKKRNEDIPK